ncbi:alcohol dehydrogenase catalytic domain-containing protein [Flammeovirga yaeyamensis]|uniref:Alcohol dehydrogenase catalytic domain-containing protein n=1 Tax=Flammeovirga yaeyamensis TaxID=367791 RepID=A0AAX1N5R8_9BACT|nr:alcohol dehydrogenase catalytic domain-containing protein [Flammeovirga yaeyamensis]MBB3697403.1 2-desacetyl-2-hydroxyethyl bacteriochlorophyllide A dehydrogenase [Flammeovirga yaeyamensis]NMF36097.1 alcohol dehydrogenase catalytic domain-containing protein [Flammeovirga yaeyamensis]QWG02830.1 alcohol dehydrogenase catalytic domain-containing protein [Flammeovirga yaeyamensis]
MKASLYEGNQTFTVVEKDIEAPAAGEVRIKVAYCGVCGTDVHIYHGMMDKRVNIPLTIGHEMSGTVDAVGEGVEGYKVGEKITVRPLDNRGETAADKGHSHIAKALKFIGIDSPGAMQQYWNVPAFTLHKLKEETDLKLAALIEPLSVACHDVRMSRLKKDEVAVVLGGGPIGLLVAMVAKSKGAHVIISEVNDARIKMAEGMGFEVVNPINTDLVAYVDQQTEGGLADVVFEVAGVQASLDVMTEVAGIRGRIVMVAIHGEKKPVDLFKFFWKELELIGARVYEKEDYEESIQLITENKYNFDKIITATKPIDDIQQIFEDIDKNPTGMKFLIDCQ